MVHKLNREFKKRRHLSKFFSKLFALRPEPMYAGKEGELMQSSQKTFLQVLIKILHSFLRSKEKKHLIEPVF